MSRANRKARLAAQNVFTGLDFVQVVDRDVQDVLRLFFIVDPDQLEPVLADDSADFNDGTFTMEIIAVHGGAEIELRAPAESAGGINPRWVTEEIGGVDRTFLEFEVDGPGGFEPYELRFRHIPASGTSRIDPFFSRLIFDFKQACETGFDCQSDQKCDDIAGVDFPVDYLARDFHSIRRALLDFSAQRYPDWREPIEADMAVMLMEIMAAMGDEFAYIQDRNDAETRFASATQRNSLHALARLADYIAFPGEAASGEVVLHAEDGFGGGVADGAVVWAAGADGSAIPFNLNSIGWIHRAWNNVSIHNPNPDVDCLARGQTSLLLVAPEETDQVPEDPDNPGNPLPFADFLFGRTMMVLSDPVDASLSRKAQSVRITRIEELEDPIILRPDDSPTPLIRVHWDKDEAILFDLPFDGLSAALNVTAATAGQKITEFARIGNDDDIKNALSAEPPLVLDKILSLPRVVERQGPQIDDAGTRSIIFRYGLSATETSSLRFGRQGKPTISVTEIVPPAVYPDPLPFDPSEMASEFNDDPASGWTYTDDLLEGDLDTALFTVEPGQWRTVKNYQLPASDFPFRDYAGDFGWTLKFGYGDLGRAPADGTVIRIDYDTDPGTAGNVSSFSIQLGLGDAHPADTNLDGRVARLFNPLPFTNAREEESRESIRLNAPQAYRARPRRAVRPEDYSAIIERLQIVQKAHSVTRWTGSWSTDFVSADPLDSITLADDDRLALEQEVNCIRLAARDARLLDPDYVDIDIEILICIAKGFYSGAVREDVIEALASPGFFHPDNFTFGQSLYRSALVAAAQSVVGVSHIDGVNIRVHGQGEWRAFSEDALDTGPGQIIRLQNDPNRSTLGLLRVETIGEM